VEEEEQAELAELEEQADGLEEWDEEARDLRSDDEA
jgi:hypothetical protein